MTEIRHSRVYAVAGGNHVAILIDAAETDGEFDLIEVLAQPGGGPPPHRHAFAEWFHVLDGLLEILTPVAEGSSRWRRLNPVRPTSPPRGYPTPPATSVTGRFVSSSLVGPGT